MRLNIDVGKDKVDAALQAEIDRLKKENAKMKRQLEEANRKADYTTKQRDEINSFYQDLKAVFKKHSWDFDAHEDCH